MAAPSRRHLPLFSIDPSWLLLVAGLALAAATVLIPAQQDLAEARWNRDCAALVEQRKLDRLGRYAAYIDAVDRRDDAAIIGLVHTQLNMLPVGRRPLFAVRSAAPGDASPFPALEPDPLILPEPPGQASRLGRWATTPQGHLWLIAASAFLIFVGLLPAAAKPYRPS